MGILLTQAKAIATCDACGISVQINPATGIVPAEWMTGQLWLDLSLSQQMQRPLCFCQNCKPGIPDSLQFVVGTQADQ
jgi:hypothetical protein